MSKDERIPLQCPRRPNQLRQQAQLQVQQSGKVAAGTQTPRSSSLPKLSAARAAFPRFRVSRACTTLRVSRACTRCIQARRLWSSESGCIAPSQGVHSWEPASRAHLVWSSSSESTHIQQVEAKGPKQARPPSYKPVYIHASTLTTGKQPRTLSVAGDSERRGGVVGGGVTGSGRVGTAGSFAQTQMRAKRLRTARGGDIPWTPPHGW